MNPLGAHVDNAVFQRCRRNIHSERIDGGEHRHHVFNIFKLQIARFNHHCHRRGSINRSGSGVGAVEAQHYVATVKHGTRDIHIGCGKIVARRLQSKFLYPRREEHERIRTPKAISHIMQ